MSKLIITKQSKDWELEPPQELVLRVVGISKEWGLKGLTKEQIYQAVKLLDPYITKEKARAELVFLKSLLSPRYLREVTTTMTDTNGGVYQYESNLHISEYEVRERIAELEAQLASEDRP